MWKDSNRNIVVIFQPNILRIVGFYVRHSAKINLTFIELSKFNAYLERVSSGMVDYVAVVLLFEGRLYH